MDSADVTLAERQEYELQALQAIYLEDVVDLRKKGGETPEVQIYLRPQESMHAAVAHTSIYLIVKFTRCYPEEVPAIRLERAKGLSDQQVKLLNQELDALARKSIGEEMVLALCQHVQTFLRAHNKPPSKSFYDQMLLNRQLKEQKAAQAAEKQQEYQRQFEEQQRQQIDQELQRKQEALKEDTRRRRELARQEKEQLRMSRSCSPRKSISVPGTSPEQDYFMDLYPPAEGCTVIKFTGREDCTVYKGKCLGQSLSRGSRVYVGVDAKTLDLVAVTEWDISFRKPSAPDVMTCANDIVAKLHNLVLSIQHELLSLLSLHHANLVRYLGFSYSLQASTVKISILSEYASGSTISTWIQKHLPLPLDVVRYFTRETLEAIAFLHSNSVIHEDLRPSSLFLDSSGCIRVTDYVICARIKDLRHRVDVQYLSHLSDGDARQKSNSASKKADILRLGLLVLSLVHGRDVTEKHPEIPTNLPADLHDFLSGCLQVDESLRWNVHKLTEHVFMKTPVNKCLLASNIQASASACLQLRSTAATCQDGRSNVTQEDDNDISCVIPYISTAASRLHSEFQILSEIGRGAFGDVIKVRNKLDGRCYAIKRIPLNSSKKQLMKKITREVKLLSRLNHENVVRYFNSWIETTEQMVSSSTSSTVSPSQSFSQDSEICKPPKQSKASDFIADKLLPEEITPAAAESNGLSEWNNTSDGSEDTVDDESDDETSGIDDDDVFGKFRLFSDESEDSIQFLHDSDDQLEDAETESKISKPCGLIDKQTLPDNHSPAKLQYLYIQMEFCEKSTLRDCIDAGLHLDVNRVWQLFREIVDGLVHIHEQGMIHRDLKPVNIFLDSENHVKIGDFGLATTDIIAATETGLQEMTINALEAVEKSGSTGDHDIGVGGSLTGHVGTALYVSPEMMTCNGRYNQKVDLYSLGVIFFEMCYRPMSTGMERIKTLTSLRSPAIEFPDDFNEFELKNQAHIIRWLLDHDPSKRPTSRELLKSDYLPPAQMEESELHEVLRSTIANPNSTTYRTMMRTIFSQPLALPASDFAYDSDIYKMAASTIAHHAMVQRAVTDLLERTFRKHGAVRLATPLLMPRCSVYDNSEAYVCMMDHNGTLIGLPYDSRVPFARYIARSGVTQLKRYLIDNVYRENRLPGLHPRELCACTFDIVSNIPAMALIADAEVITVVSEIIAEVPALGARNCRLRVNHTALVKAVLLHCGISENLHADVYSILGDNKVEKQQKQQVWTLLSTTLSISDQSVDQLCNFIFHEGEFHQLAKQLQYITRTSGMVGSLAKKGLHELDALLTHVETLGCKFQPVLAVGLLSNIHHFSGIFFQIVYDIKWKNRATADVLAAGGRYDQLITRFGKPGIPVQGVQGAVGVSIAYDKIVCAAMEKSNPLTVPPVTDALVCSLGYRSVTKELLLIVKELWNIGVSADLYLDGNSSLEDIKDHCRQKHICHLIVQKDSEISLIKLQSLEKDRVVKKDLTLAELTDYFRQFSARSSETADLVISKSQASPLVGYTAESSSGMYMGGSAGGGNSGSGGCVNSGGVSTGVAGSAVPQYDISFVLPDANKLAKNMKRSYESQIAANITSTLSRLSPRCRVEVIGVDLGMSVIKSLAVHLDLSKDEDTLTASVASTIKEYPRYKKYMNKIVSEISDLKFEKGKQSPVVILYSLSDDGHRMLL